VTTALAGSSTPPLMQASSITTLALVLGVIMFGLGLHLKGADFVRFVQMPRAVFVGLAAQMLILPPIAFLRCLAFERSPLLAVGLMLLTVSSGGATST
jgi:BASS family bile acid:Na+ symporter